LTGRARRSVETAHRNYRGKEIVMLKIGIVVGSTRPGRKAEHVATWVHDIAKRRDEIFMLCT
jgi:hypothetical protein